MLIPDDKPDIAVSTPMADEIPLANVVRVIRCGDYWVARIGPPDRGLTDFGLSPERAVTDLMRRCELLNWSWDETWVDRLE